MNEEDERRDSSSVDLCVFLLKNIYKESLTSKKR